MSKTSAAISALVDNQATDLDLARLLRQLNDPTASAAALAKWRNYHLMAEVFRGELPANQALKFSQLDISEKVAASLAKEAPLKTKPSLASQWLKTSALAASVALVVLVTAQLFNQESNFQPSVISQPNSLVTQQPTSTPANLASQKVSFSSGCQPKSLQGLTKPPYLAQASKLEQQAPCSGFALSGLTSNPAQAVSFTPINAP